MKTIKILVLSFALLVTLMVPASASTSLSMLTWVHTADGMGEGSPVSCPDTFSIVFSPSYSLDHTVYAGTYIGVYRSTDQGLTWTNKMASTQPAINSMAATYLGAHTLIAATENGILHTTDGWDTYSGIGPAGMAVQTVVFSPDYWMDHMIFAGTDENGIRVMTDKLSWWSIDEGTVLGKVTGIVFDPNFAVNHILYASSTLSGVYKGDGGANMSSWAWTELNTGLDTANKKFVGALAMSPNFAIDQTLFIASDGVGIYKSVDAGQHWNVAYNNLGFQTLLFSPNFATDRTIYAGEDGRGVFRSTDGGETWNQMNRGFADADFGGSVLTLAFAPGKPINLFAGFWGGGDGGVWQFLFPSSQVFLPLVKR